MIFAELNIAYPPWVIPLVEYLLNGRLSKIWPLHKDELGCYILNGSVLEYLVVHTF